MDGNGEINYLADDIVITRSYGTNEIDVTEKLVTDNGRENGRSPPNPSEDTKEAPSPYTAREIVTLITLVALNTSSAMFYSLLAPFFPLEAQLKGASSSEIGFILGAFQLVNFVMFPIFGYQMTRIGSKFLVVAGNFVCSACAIMFGMLQWSPLGLTFVGLCIATRSIEAIGAAAQSTASFAIAAHTFPNKISTVMGILQAGSCIGLLAGPPIGGTLYAYGGYHMPFLVTGSIFMVFTLFCAFILPPSADEDSRGASLSLKLKLVRTPVVIVIGYIVFLGQAAIGFIDVALSPHIRKLQPTISTIYIGLIFLIPSAIVVLLAPVYGILTDKFKSLGRPLILMGVLGCVGTFLCLGPSPLLSSLIPNQQVHDVIIILSISGVGWGSLILTYQQFVLAAKRIGLPEGLETQGVISGINGAFNSSGAFFGPTIGGIMIQHIGFPWACTVIAAMAAIGSVMLFAYMVFTATCCPEKTTLSERENHRGDPERAGLLQNESGLPGTEECTSTPTPAT